MEAGDRSPGHSGDFDELEESGFIPDAANLTKVRWFYLDQTGVIRYRTGRTAGPNAPPAT